MKLIAALTVPVSLLLAQNPAPAPLSVVAVRHFILHDATRVAIEVSGSFEFRTDRLHNPERVYYDILNSIPRIKGRRLYSEAVDDKLLLRIRIAETAKGVTRVVLDLGDNVEPTSSTLTNPNRLIVELRHAPGSTPTSAPTLIAAPTETSAAASPAPLASAPPIAIQSPPSTVKPVASLVPATPGPTPPATTPPAAKPSAATPSPATLPAAKPPAAKPPVTAPPAAAPMGPEEIASAARHTSSGQNSLIRALGLKINRVVIDPGHGGHDNGTEGPKGLLEKDLVLDVSQRLGRLIEDRMAAEVIYTRTDDTFVPLEGRTALANEKKADLFLSIHANSSSISKIAGVETFYLNITGTRDALDLAARENASAQTSIFELQDIIKKITLHDKSEESLEFAKRIQAALFSFSAKNIPASKDRGVKSAPFIVLIGANMPSVLAEIGFLSNPREEALLKKSDYRDKLAEALYKGIERYATGLSHFQVAARP
ncbi:MAG: N-acetylmuramoyl-L-alanine amidase [Bryobacteraceae bacterium]|jgi:N-acetylmuramoyl-L-alanine amidase